MLKGWFDRVLVHGALHSSEARFDRGLCVGKKALFCVTAGSSEFESSASGKEGDIRLLLWPLAYGLRYLGFTVLEPETVHGVHGFHTGAAQNELAEQLQGVLRAQQGLIDSVDARACIASARTPVRRSPRERVAGRGSISALYRHDIDVADGMPK